MDEESWWIIAYSLSSYFVVGLYGRLRYTRDEFNEFFPAFFTSPITLPVMIMFPFAMILFFLLIYPFAWLATFGWIDNPITFTRNFFKEL